MDNITQIIAIFIFSSLFVSIYALHRLFFNNSYFGFSELIYGYKQSITMKAVIYKLIIPIFYSIILYNICKSEYIVLSSVFGGSILIVTPPFLNRDNIDYRFVNKQIVLYLIYILFVATNFLITLWMLSLVKPISFLLNGYLSQFKNPQMFFNHIMDTLILPIIIGVIIALFHPLINSLNKEIKINSEHTNE